MASDDINVQQNSFNATLAILKNNLSYVEDTTFSWKDVISVLIIKLSNTDSINKANDASNATQIQLTSERDASAGQRKTEDFFPTLTLNSTFKGWRIGVPVRLNKMNLEALGANTTGFSTNWEKDQVQIRRRILNADEHGNGNPTLQICYGNDLMPLRKALGVDDYIVFGKRKDASVYETFGVLKNVDLGKGKKMYVSEKSDKDSTNFGLTDITIEAENDTYNNELSIILDALRQEWMDKDNQEFILSCLDFMKSHSLFTDTSLEILQNKEQCATLFRHNSLNGILLRVNHELSEDKQRKDANGNSRYYSEKYTILENNYFVSSEWRADREDARKPLIDWIFAMLQKVKFNTGYQSEFPRNRILFGAPGTGKSFTLNHEKDILLADGGEYERVTFHPDYSYANFVGTYKPVPCKDSDGKDAITYSYVPGPFMRTYVKALQNSRTDSPKPFLLVIEEINRANVAAVFGDVFQLLDRGDDEVSEYPIQASEDIKKYLARELDGNPDDYAEIRIPDNMFIWATMNSADQGVFPMDTAFKRRWDFTYLDIDYSEAEIVGKKVILGQDKCRRVVEWNKLRKAINDELLTYKVNEDKLMGPFFISKKNLSKDEMIDSDVFTRIFKNKVIMYLFDDAAKQKRITLFGGCNEKARNQYSKICEEFDTKGVFIFCEGISSQFTDKVPEGDGE